MSWELRSLTAINRSPLNAVVTTLERPGAHWAVRMPYQNLAESRRARLQSFVSSARGHAQRFYVPVYGWTRRGSFPSSELVTNGTFADGTTGWTAGTGWSLSASDEVLRATQTSSAANNVPAFRTIATTQYAPHVLRALNLIGRGALTPGVFWNSGGETSSAASALSTLAKVALSTSDTVGIYQPAAVTFAGNYLGCAFVSASRCALVDNGLNLLLRSDEFDNAAWTKTELTVSADATPAPDGATTGDDLTPSTNNATHAVEQAVTVASSALDIALQGAFKGNGYNFVRLQLEETSTVAYQVFDVVNGVVGTTTSTGANWSNLRAFIAPLGDGWYYCCVVVRKTSAATSVTVKLIAESADSAATFAGDGASGVRAWRATAAVSGVPVRLTQTTTAAATGTSQTGGALRLKGLPASTSGLLLKGDPVEIITGSTSQLVRTREPLNSDAAGLGHWEFEPPLRISPSDNAAVIIENPMCRMMMENNVNGWTDRLGGFADLEFAAVEDVSP